MDVNFITTEINGYKIRKYDYIEIPCGKCIGCRLDYSRQWADRCMLEAKQHEHNYFLTLTYENKPETTSVNVETGEVEEQGTLVKKDLQDFQKRLRRHYEYHLKGQDIKYYACGEYGSLRSRPHYHGIYFNLPIDDLEFSHKSKGGYPVYKSETIQKIWGKGIVGIGEVTWETCAYTARYIMKKQKGVTKGHVEIGGELWKGPLPEFTTMSTRPAIAKGYYNENKDTFYLNDQIYIKTAKGVQNVKPARYFDKLFDLENPEQMKKIKEERQEIAKIKQKNKLLNTDKSKNCIRSDERETKEEQIRRLIRSYEKDGMII